MFKKIGVAFDLEGTVIDVEAAHHRAHLEIAKQLGLNLTLTEALQKIEHFIGGPDDLIMKEILILSGKSDDPQKLWQEDRKLYKRFLSTTATKVRRGFKECLEKFTKYGVAVSVGSATEQDEARYLITNSGLDKLISAENIVYREDVNNLKPAPDVFIETAKRMKVEPACQIVFEDSPRGVAAAVVAGSKMVIGMPVYDLSSTRSALHEAGAWRIFGSWKEVDVDAIIQALN